MKAPGIPENENARLAALKRLELLDTDPEERFDRIVRMTRDIFEVPIVLISLVDANRQWFKACIGLDVNETSREVSFCGHAIHRPETFVISDTLEDDRFIDNPLVTGDPHIRFYAGHPLSGTDGMRVGTLCMIDRVPRELTDARLALFQDIAALVVREFELSEVSVLQQELGKANVELNQFFDLGIDMMCVAGTDGYFKKLNPRWSQVLGYTDEELTGRPWVEFVHPEDVDATVEEAANLVAGAKTLQFENRYHCKDGGYRWLQWAATADLDEGVLYCNARDITEQKELEEQRGFEEKLERIIHRVQSLDLPDKSASQVFEELLANLLELTDSEYGFIGEVLQSEDGSPYLRTHAITDISWNDETRNFYKTYAPEGLKFQNLETLFGRVMTGGEVVIANDPYNDPRRGGLPSGHPALNKFLGVPFFVGKELVGMVGVANRPNGYDDALVADLQPLLSVCSSMIQAARNLASRREAEAALRESESVIRRLYEISTDSVSIEDRVEQMLHLGCESLGMELGILSQVNGDSYVVESVVYPEEMPVETGAEFELGSTYCSRTLSLGKTLAVAEAGQHADWKDHPAYEAFQLESYIGAPVIVDGETYGTINFSARESRPTPFKDIHLDLVRLMSDWVGASLERQRSRDRLLQAKESAEAANLAKSLFLANMSHELRTPLNSVIGFASVLLKKAASLDEQHRTYLERIEANGKHLLELINDVLDLSKIEAGKMDLQIEDLDVCVVIDDVLQQMAVQAELRSLELGSTISCRPCLIPADAARIRQVLINLVGNAVKFTETGKVEVELQCDDGRTQSLIVRDTGIGIEEDKIDTIFDKFQQADSSTARKYGGTGLGLPISRQLCDLMGFDLMVRSEVGGGSEFEIRFG